MIEGEYKSVNFENSILNEKFTEMRALSEVVAKEKIGIEKELMQARSEMSSLKDSNKTLGRKLNTGLAEKDNRVAQFEQTLTRKILDYNEGLRMDL